MADVVKIDRTNSNGAEVLAAAQMIAAGLAILWKLNGLRANAIGGGPPRCRRCSAWIRAAMPRRSVTAGRA